MKFILHYSKQKAKAEISGAVGFNHINFSLVRNTKYTKKVITNDEMRMLCEELDTDDQEYNSIEEFLKDNKYFMGSRKYRLNELNRIIKINPKHMRGVLASFPFKCPVPSKTNYHTRPDFGEVMFLYRLGKICRIFQKIRHRPMQITILEETQALENVFKVSKQEGKIVRKTLQLFITLLRLEKEIKIISLQREIEKSNKIYNLKLKEKTSYIALHQAKYKMFLSQILSTIALSMRCNHMSIADAQKYINGFFYKEVSLVKNPALFSTAFRYIAYVLLQKESKFKEKKYNDFLQLSVCPKKGRIAIVPTFKHIPILPHHGVPVIYLNKVKNFSIEYYIDFLEKTKRKKVSEVCSEEGGFLYYEVDERKVASV